MRLKGCLIPVHLVKIETVRVVPVLNHIKAQTTGLVLLRMLGIVTDNFQEIGAMLGFYLNSNVQNQHKMFLPLGLLRVCLIGAWVVGYDSLLFVGVVPGDNPN